MAAYKQCPDLDAITAHAKDRLGAERSLELDNHLSRCRACLQQYFELGRKSMLPQIKDCRIVKEIGRGRFGVVYKAWWMKGQPQVVALKVLSLSGDMERERFDREISVLERIESPWIVKCLESGTVNDTQYFVMDHVNGTHLDEYLAERCETLIEKLTIFQRVCQAVGDAHRVGVVHRDLKPRNIIIDDDGNPHILDFGICSIDATGWSSSVRQTITHLGDVLGTLKYMSPEQAWGGVSGTIDERSDIWSLGVMLFEIVTDGDYPYPLTATPDQSPQEALLERIRKQLPRMPELHDVDRARDIRILIERCMTWERTSRLNNVQMLADDLDAYCRGDRIRTKPLTMRYRLRRLAIGAATKSRWGFAAVFVAFVGLTIWTSTILFNVRWQVDGAAYLGANMSASSMVSTLNPQNSIVIVGVFDETIDAVELIAKAQGMVGVTKNIRSWRGVHGRLLDRLRSARPGAVVWDYYFRSEQPGDHALAQAVMRLDKAGIPVVLATRNYDQAGRPALSPTLLRILGDKLRHGAIVARDMVKREGEFVLAVHRQDGVTFPTLSLAALSSVLHPNAVLDVAAGQSSWDISLLYQTGPGTYLRERDIIDTTKSMESQVDGPGIQKGDFLYSLTCSLHDPASWESRTIAYESILTADDETIAKMVAGKLVLIGDFRQARWGLPSDRHAAKYSQGIIEDVPGVYLQADVMTALLHRRYYRAAFPPAGATFPLMLLIATVGCLIPIRLTRRPFFDADIWRHRLHIAVLFGAGASFVLFVVSESSIGVHASMAGFALLGPMVGSLWVEFVRNRHRILDRKRHSVNDICSALNDTLTIQPKRATSC